MSAPSIRTLTTTVVAVVSPDTRGGVVAALSSLSRISGVRPVIVVLGDAREAEPREEDGALVIDGLVQRYLNNAVASLRLSSLPTLVWWRAGDPGRLPDLAALADRVVMDLDDPSAGWSVVPDIARLASVSDLRWARLTRWRDLIAQFFDMPEVKDLPTPFERLEIAGTDPHDARLLGGWLRARLPAGERLEVVRIPGGDARLRSAELKGPTGRLVVRLLPGGACLETAVEMSSGHSSSRVVALGDQGLVALLGEELRVRSRDLAFEEAVREAGGL
jgi:glucose-6-phosphate dehydrogenase assembly protein OpcA